MTHAIPTGLILRQKPNYAPLHSSRSKSRYKPHVGKKQIVKALKRKLARSALALLRQLHRLNLVPKPEVHFAKVPPATAATVPSPL